MRERWTCKGYMGCVKMRGRMGIPGGARDFAIQGMDTRNGETWDSSGTQLYVVLPL